VLWLAAAIAVLRDRTSTRRRRMVTAAILVACVPIALAYWFTSGA
jgi:hypothetical protein